MHGISFLIFMAGIRSGANGWFTLTRTFTFKGTSPTNHFFARRDRPVNEYLTTISLTVFTQRNFVADFLKVKYNFKRKTAVLRF